MDSPIRPIEDSPITRPAPVRRRRENEERPFDLERELTGDPQDGPRRDDAEESTVHENHHADTPVAPPEEGEAGGHLDVTA